MLLLQLQPSCLSPLAMSAAVRKTQYKSRGPTQSAKERLRTECLARVREHRLSIIAAVREKQSAQHPFHSSQSSPAADEQAAHDVAAASFNAIINTAMAAQRNEQQQQQPPFGTNRSPLSPLSTPDSPCLPLSQQSTASAPSPSHHSRFHTSHHSDTPGSSSSAPPTHVYSPSVHPHPFPHSLLQSMPAAVDDMKQMDERDGGMEEDEVAAMSQADYVQLMNDMQKELWSEQQLIESEENLSLMHKDDGWLDPDGDSLSQEVSTSHVSHHSYPRSLRFHIATRLCLTCFCSRSSVTVSVRSMRRGCKRAAHNECTD